MKKIKLKPAIIAILAVLGLFAISASSCGSNGGSSSSEVRKEQKNQNQASTQLLQNQPTPKFKFSQLRQNLIEIKTAEAKGVQTTSFFFQMGDPDPVFVCPSIGAPIDAGDTLSNGQQIVTQGSLNSSGGNAVVEQMDPTGEYSSGNGSGGTYSVCLDSTGQAYAHYWEGQVMVTFAPAIWDSAAARQGKPGIKIIGKPSFEFTEGK